VRFGKTCTRCALPLTEIESGIIAESVETEVKPIRHHLQHLLRDLKGIIIEVGLMAEEAMPVIDMGYRIPCPVGFLRIAENNVRLLVPLISVTPDILVTLRGGG
jgi:hypothetical protein